MSEYTKIVKPITLHPHIPNKDEAICTVCGGIGWLNDNDKYIVRCNSCNDGIVFRCKYCNEPMKKEGYTWKCTNPNCNYEELEAKVREQRQANIEKERHDKAIHYTIDNVPKECIDFLYSDNYGYDEGFFTDLEKLKDYCTDNDVEFPDYVWCTKINPFKLDATDFIYRALEDEDRYEDAYERVDEKELNKLQIACDEFVKAHNGLLDIYDIDYKHSLELVTKGE